MLSDDEKLQQAYHLVNGEFPAAYERLMSKGMKEKAEMLARQVALRAGLEENMECLVRKYSCPQNPFRFDDARRPEMISEFKALFPGNDSLALTAIQLYELNMACYGIADAMLRVAVSELQDSCSDRKKLVNIAYRQANEQLQRCYMNAGGSDGVGLATAKAKTGQFEGVLYAAICDGLGLQRGHRQ